MQYIYIYSLHYNNKQYGQYLDAIKSKHGPKRYHEDINDYRMLVAQCQTTR